MKIGFIHARPIKVLSDGVRSQALAWKLGLESLGHEVSLINMWDRNEWKSFDIIHFFSFSEYMSDLVQYLHLVGVKVVLSPVFDPHYSKFVGKIYARWGSRKLHLMNNCSLLRDVRKLIDLCLVRSEFEKQYMVECFNIDSEICEIIPLSLRLDLVNPVIIKENICLHISLLADERKNVKRLIDAARKFQFPLLLGGLLRNEEEYKLIVNWIGNATNIKYLGFLSEEEIMYYYSRAKVFALPSTNEGVGLVALEAASMGCDIVITSFGGPKEYYDGMAKVVNPYKVDEIGEAVIDLLKGETFQPKLMEYVRKKYSRLTVAEQLECAYNNVINGQYVNT